MYELTDNVLLNNLKDINPKLAIVDKLGVLDECKVNQYLVPAVNVNVVVAVLIPNVEQSKLADSYNLLISFRIIYY